MALPDNPRTAPPPPPPPPPPPAALGSWRFQRREENLTALSFAVAIAGTFLVIGLTGIYLHEAPFSITLSGRAGQGASDAITTELTMADLQAMEQTPAVQPSDAVTPQPIPPPTVTPDLPELTQALVAEDVFIVPAASKIEPALTLIEPPKPKPKPAAANKARAASTAAVNPGGTQGSGGGGGGSGAAGSGAGTGKFPKPNYPSTARSRGVSGQITLALTVTPSGQVESASAISSQGGFTSEEQDAVAAFVQRYWQFPTGPNRKHNVKIIFNLSNR